MRTRLTVAAAFAALTLCATQANASYLVQVAYGDPSTGVATGIADSSHILGLPLYAKFTYGGPIDFVNNNPDNSQNTFANFFNFADISGFSGSVTEAAFASAIMSNPGPSEGTCSGAGETGCLVTDLLIIGSSAGGLASVLHDDGASLYVLSGGLTTVFESADPTSAITSTGMLPAGSFALFYVEANGSPSVLTMSVASSVPEPAGAAVLGVGLLGLGLGAARRRG